MMKRRAIPIALLALAGVVAGAPAPADAAVSDAVIIALNSIEIDRVADVTGDIVVNETNTAPNHGPSGADLDIDRDSTVVGDLYAETISLGTNVITGAVFEGGTYDPPIFEPLPAFRSATPGSGAGSNCDPGADCSIAANDTVSLPPGSYGAITLAPGSTLVLAEGGYDVASIQPVPGKGTRTIRFDGAAQLRVAGRFDLESNAVIAAGPGLTARDLVIYVGGANIDPQDPTSRPAAASLGKGSSAQANFYVAAGTFVLERQSSLTGSVIALDAHFHRESTLVLESAFNFAPVADPQTVFTVDDVANINLTATDEDGDILTFTLVSGPSFGTLGINDLPASDAANPTATVPVTYTGADAVQDQFVFMVDDGKGGTDTAIVNINPTEICVDDNDCDAGQFCDLSVEPPDGPACSPIPGDELIAQDAFYETAIDTPINILTLTAQAPDTVGDLEFQITAQPPAAEGSVSTPPSPASSRSAEVTFTPASGFAGETNFSFEACELPALTNCDSATITVNIQAFTPPAPPVALDQSVTTGANTSVEIDLANPIGSEGDTSEGGREGCGDGDLDPGEQCDDGNMVNGDGCDDQCNIE